MQDKWNQKKKTGNFKADGITTMSEALSKREKELKQAADIFNRNKENKDDKLTSIYNKMQSGSALTLEEIDYLKEKNPAAYQQFKQSEEEKKRFEEKIKQCKTKEDVDRLKMQHINAAVATIKKVENNPNISDGDKLAVACAVQKRMNDIAKITMKFIKNGDYAKLPTDAEVQKANDDMEKAEENEIRDISDNKSENNSSELTEENLKKDIAIKSVEEKDREITRTEAETSDEALKIKRSKVKNAYTDGMETEINSLLPVGNNDILSEEI